MSAFRLALSALALLSATFASADPADLGEIVITRNASSELTLRGKLLKNEYRYVEREITEWIDVPYTVEVPYQDLETYYELEYQCRPVHREQCSREQRCTNETVVTPVCRDLERCSSTTGQCHVERVCKDEVKSYPRCTTVPVCRTYTENVCGYVNVLRSRYVTRYRTETRYRQEQRTRTVTDRIFDRQWGVNVAIRMPEDATLERGETETVLVRLTGDERKPNIDVQIDSSIYAYRVVSAQDQNGVLTRVLRTVPKYTPTDLGEATIENLVMVPVGGGKHQVRFVDRGVVARTQTRYLLAVGDVDRRETIFETELEGVFGKREVVIPVDAAVDSTNDHALRLTVIRDGVVLSDPVNFVKAARQVGQLDPAPYVDPNGVREFRIDGSQNEAVLTFTDATPKNHKVETSYDIRLMRKGGLFKLGKKELARAVLLRKNLKHDGENTVRVSLDAFPGLDAQELSKHLESGDQVIVQVQIRRESPRLVGHSPVEIKKEAKLRVK